MMHYPVVCIDRGYPPTLAGVLLANALSLPLSSCIVDVPAMDILFWGLRLVRKCIEFIHSTKLAGPRLYAIIDIPGLLLVGEAETNEVEVSAS